MIGFNFESNPLWVNALLFSVAAGMVWLAGTRLERIADAIADRTGLGKVFAGLLLLAGVTSLPEVATTITATWGGHTVLAVHNLLGGVAMQTAVLVIADAAVKRGALTRISPRYALVMQGVSLVLMLSIVSCWIAVDHRTDIPLGWISRGAGISAGALVLLGTYLTVVWAIYRAQGQERWKPLFGSDHATPNVRKDEARHPSPLRDVAALRLCSEFAVVSLVVLAAGWSVAELGATLAEQTGLGARFIGATLVAVATSLPEISTTVAAVRHANYGMAIANVFGSNMFMLTLLVLVDLIAPGPLFGPSPASATFGAGLGIAVTCIYLWGLLEHRDRTVWRLGWDSVVVAVLYLAGIGVLYTLRDASSAATPPTAPPPSQVERIGSP